MHKVPFPPELVCLRDKLHCIALRETQRGLPTDPDSILYHYTGRQGMQGILNTGKLWATCLPDLKDKREVEYPETRCVEYLESRGQEEKDSHKKKFLSVTYDLASQAREIVHCLENQAAACLSKKTKLKKQWQKYGDEGRGYALGFRLQGLLDVLKSWMRDRNSLTDINWTLRNMVYDRNEQNEILGKLLDTVFACPHFLNRGSEEMFKTLTGLTAQYFGFAAQTFKCFGFAPEHEVRLTIANHRDLYIAGTPLLFEERRQGERTVRYLKINLRHRERGLVPLSEILIGPEADDDAPDEIIQLIRDSSFYARIAPGKIRRMQWDDMQ